MFLCRGLSDLISSCSVYVPSVPVLYVSDSSGNDNNDGTTALTALKTITEASHRCVPGNFQMHKLVQS